MNPRALAVICWLLAFPFIHGCATSNPKNVVPDLDPALRMSMTSPLYVQYEDGPYGYNCHTWAGSKLGLWPEGYAEAISLTLAQQGAMLTPEASSAQYTLSFQKVPETQNDTMYEQNIVVAAHARRVDADRVVYFEVRQTSSGHAVWHSLQRWPLFVNECALCCDKEAKVHFSEIAQALAAWDGAPSIVQPGEVVGIVDELKSGAASLPDLITALPLISPALAPFLPNDVGTLLYEADVPDEYIRHLAGRIAQGDRFDQVRPNLQSAGRGFGIIRIEPVGDTVIYHLGNSARWVDAYEAENGWPATMVLNARAAALNAAEASYWQQALPTQFDASEGMYEEECELHFDRTSQTVTKNTCPAVASSFDPTIPRIDAIIISVNGFSDNEAMIPDYDIVAWLHFVDGELEQDLGPIRTSNGQLADISDSTSLPSPWRFKPSLLRD